jgi:hypothetical protein
VPLRSIARFIRFPIHSRFFPFVFLLLVPPRPSRRLPPTYLQQSPLSLALCRHPRMCLGVCMRSERKEP